MQALAREYEIRTKGETADKDSIKPAGGSRYVNQLDPDRGEADESSAGKESQPGIGCEDHRLARLQPGSLQAQRIGISLLIEAKKTGCLGRCS